jgi:hypothetical protein
MVVWYVWMCMFQEDDEEKCLVGRELERRAAKAEEEVKQKDEEMRQKEQLIATLQRQVQHYESRLSECEVRMKSVERQITSLQVQVQYKTFAFNSFFVHACMHRAYILTTVELHADGSQSQPDRWRKRKERWIDEAHPGIISWRPSAVVSAIVSEAPAARFRARRCRREREDDTGGAGSEPAGQGVPDGEGGVRAQRARGGGGQQAADVVVHSWQRQVGGGAQDAQEPVRHVEKGVRGPAEEDQGRAQEARPRREEERRRRPARAPAAVRVVEDQSAQMLQGAQVLQQLQATQPQIVLLLLPPLMHT